MARTMSTAAFSTYLFLLLSLVWAYTPTGYREAAYHYNLSPFKGIARDISKGGQGFWVNVVGNVVVFAPFGLAIRGFRGPRASLAQAALASAALSTLIEVVQFQSGRRFSDVDDVILNTFGGVAGYTAACALAWTFGRRGEAVPYPTNSRIGSPLSRR